jgi:hypothetical protein
MAVCSTVIIKEYQFLIFFIVREPFRYLCKVAEQAQDPQLPLCLDFIGPPMGWTCFASQASIF